MRPLEGVTETQCAAILFERGRRLSSPLEDRAEIRVDEVMTKPLIVVNPSLKVEMIARLFAHHKVGHAPVIDDHRLVGIVSMTDLVVEVITEPI